MKKLQYFTYLLMIITALACSKASDSSSYETKMHTDANGFKYETVTNDPSGLRLYTLENGLKVYLSQNQDEPKIQTYIAVRAGSSYDPKESTGLAHYLEHMLFKGTSHYGTTNWKAEEPLIAQISDLYELHRAEKDPEKKDAIYRQIDSISFVASKFTVANEFDKMVASIGATGTNAHTGFEETIYHNKIPANELKKFLTLERERFDNLVLRLFHTELEAVYEEFNRIQDSDPHKEYFAKLDGLYPTHPYGQQTAIGSSEHLKNPSLVDINNYFDKYYVPNNMAVVLVGDLNFDNTIKMVDATLGTMERKEVTHPELPKEKPMTDIVVREVFGPNNESVELAWRTDGVGSKDEKFITLLDMILTNGKAGLFDLNLNQKQLVQYAYTNPTFNNDYGYIDLHGIPKADQTLDEVKDLMLGEIEKLKKGEFDEWLMEATINDLKLRETRQYESATGLAGMYFSAFIHKEKWSDKMQFLEDLRKITKEELVTFANEFFKDNYALVYKRMGEDKNIVKVKNPKITPIELNRGKQSEFMASFNAMESEELKPLFVDYKKEIQKNTLDSGIGMSYIINKTNDLFNLNIIFDMGNDNDKKLSLAVGYLEYLGTEKYSAEAFAQELYKLGINHSVNTGSDRSYVTISGLQENMDKGLELLEHLMANVVVDREAYEKYVASILKARADGKTQKANVLRNGLNSYAQYGENSRLRDIYNADELMEMDPSELVEIIRDLSNFKHRIFYYGNDVNGAVTSLNMHHKVSKELKDYPPAKKYNQLATGKNVYFADFDMVQSELYFIAKGDKFDPNKMAISAVFNSYFGSGMSSVVFQEIRESKSLAYAVGAVYNPSSKKEDSDRMLAYIGTQANKLPEAVDAMLELLNEMPKNEQQFNEAKDAALKKIAAQRITKSNIFWNYESLLKRGIDYDIREEMYKDIQSMSMEDVSKFFDSNVKGQNFSISVIGNKKDLDMEALKKLGKVHEMDIDYLFNYKETEVKQ
ncbi:insulinase family protein [Lutimonas halocynthiae]|uniref:M16 family metallopeptidase n=1 Tax=Lutimonas halocynthiae TaxID=1446477 RepID=UPI0025B47C39|nr:M16 family metallopeptidase [Lutimonas halocynthiae]MDN3644122.1 insulinase family protein [Lutimonas halocynthiae]